MESWSKSKSYIILDVLEARDEVDGLLNNEVFQEEESTELLPFQPMEEVIENSILVRQDVEPLIIPGKLVVDLNNNHKDLISDNDDSDGDDDERSSMNRMIFMIIEMFFLIMKKFI